MMHGGNSPRGIAHPSTKHGRYSKDIPAQLLTRYQEGVADKDLLNLSDEIALIEARIGELLSHITTQETGGSWKHLKDLFEKLHQAAEEKNGVLMIRLIDEMEPHLMAGHKEYMVWGEITFAIEARRKLVDTERKRLVDMNQFVTVKDAMLLASALSDVVRRNVSDPEILRKIHDGMESILSKAETGS